MCYAILKFVKFYGLWAFVEGFLFYKDANVHARLVLKGRVIFKLSVWWEWFFYLAILWFSIGYPKSLLLLAVFFIFFVHLVLLFMQIRKKLPIENLIHEKNPKDLLWILLIFAFDLFELFIIWRIYSDISGLAFRIG
jgi:hypothetical protein